MKVCGYEQHRLRDPYKFWSTLLDTPVRRKQRSIATYTYVSRIDEHTLQFTHGYEPDKQQQFCLLNDDDTWTITLQADDVLPRYASRLLGLMGIWVGWNKKNYSMYENACRVYQSWYLSWPYMPGIRVKEGTILDKDVLVDRKRTIETAAATQVKRKLEKVRELAPVMIRLLEAHGVKPPQYWEGRKIMGELVSEFDIDNITALDAERVFLVGRSKTSRKEFRNWNSRTQQVDVIPQETEDQFRRRCIVHGLRKLREHIYSKEGVYQYKETK